MKKHLLALTLGFTTTTAIQAANVISWDLQDFDNDGLRSDFQFYAAPTGNSAAQFGFANEDCGNGPGSCIPLQLGTSPIGMNVFTTGFSFGGSGGSDASGPILTDSPLIADITNNTLTFSVFDFSLSLLGSTENLESPASIDTTVTALGSNSYGVIVRAIQMVNEPGGSAHRFEVNWRLEGIMTTAVPLPPSVWLFSVGLAGLASIRRRRKQ